MKHTPGPWELDGCSIYKKDTDVEIAFCRPAAGRPIESQAADMQLITAAPELLEALEAFAAMIHGIPSDCPNEEMILTFKCVRTKSEAGGISVGHVRAAVAAIAKAKGGAE